MKLGSIRDIPREPQRLKAEDLLRLHHGPHILVLPNAWDAASAKVFERAGFSAIATTSAGVASSYGYPDGEHISRDEMLDCVERIARAVSLPVTADMEAGYADTPEGVAETARLVIRADAVGLNLEDSSKDPAHPLTDIPAQVEKIRAVRRAATETGVPLVINVRTDVYERLDRSDPSLLKQAIERGNAYREAGADCIFVIDADGRDTIRQLVREIQAPINILAHYGSPTIRELEELGVGRVSFGSIPMRATLALIGRIADELRQAGTYEFARAIPSYAEVNKYFEERRPQPAASPAKEN